MQQYEKVGTSGKCLGLRVRALMCAFMPFSSESLLSWDWISKGGCYKAKSFLLILFYVYLLALLLSAMQ